MLRLDKYARRRPLTMAVLLLVICAGLIVLARSRDHKNPYTIAADLPRGALVYAQCTDLPGLISQWDQSRLKQQYFDSASYQQFEHSHLALKLVERWEEFNTALGFRLDTEVIGKSAESQAALAIYDIGRLDMVFVAPLSQEKIVATEFFKAVDQFETATAQDGSEYFRRSVEADRGRQKQVLAFATINGRFVLASDEKLLLRTIANIKRKGRNDSLADEPNFKLLTQKLTPHFLTIWLDQARLNDDYYFKHYWLLQNINQLKDIRAGLVDLEQQEKKWIERREFVTAAAALQNAQFSALKAGQLAAMLPDDIPLFHLQTGDPAVFTEIAHETMLGGLAPQPVSHSKTWSWQTYGPSDFNLSRNNESTSDPYTILGSSYDRTINDPFDARVGVGEQPGANPLAAESDRRFATSFQAALGPARPTVVASAIAPHVINGPLFVEFRRVAIITLQEPDKLRAEALENAIAQAAASRVTVAGESVQLKWSNRSDGGRSWSKLELPILGWEQCYAVKDQQLIMTNSSELLKTILTAPDKNQKTGIEANGFDDLTFIRLDQRKQAFDNVMQRLDADGIAKRQQPGHENTPEFFSGNVASLLNVAADVQRVEIRRRRARNLLEEQIDFVLQERVAGNH